MRTDFLKIFLTNSYHSSQLNILRFWYLQNIQKMSEFLHQELSNKVVGCFFHVYNTLGYGFLEKVYENAMLKKFRRRGIKAEISKYGQKIRSKFWIYFCRVPYYGKVAGSYYADIFVDKKIILELKATSIIMAHDLQLCNYLRATSIEVGYSLSFGSNAFYKRRILTNDSKQNHS